MKLQPDDGLEAYMKHGLVFVSSFFLLSFFFSHFCMELYGLLPTNFFSLDIYIFSYAYFCMDCGVSTSQKDIVFRMGTFFYMMACRVGLETALHGRSSFLLEKSILWTTL